MKTNLFISLLAAAVLLSAATVRADLGHSWDSGSELPAAVDSALSSSDSSAEPASGDSSDTPATPSPSLDTQIADLLDDESLATSSSSSLDLSTFTVPLSEEEVLLDRLAVEVAAEVADDAEAPSTPDISAPVGASDTTFASGTDRIATRVSSAMAVPGVALAERGGTPNFIASDNSRNEPYASLQTFGRGDNGGSGFGEWRQVGTTELPNPSVDYTEDVTKGFSIYANAGVGEAAIGRSFADGIALESGTFSVDANHAFSDFTEKFSGFAIYGENDTELIRWGVSRNTDGGNYQTGVWYSNDGGYEYHPIVSVEEETILSSRIMYSLTWSVLGSNVSLEINGVGLENTTYQLPIGNYSAVTAIAAIVSGSDPKDTLHFDNLEVSGRAVPEPATLALLLLGTLALRPLRHK